MHAPMTALSSSQPHQRPSSPCRPCIRVATQCAAPPFPEDDQLPGSKRPERSNLETCQSRLPSGSWVLWIRSNDPVGSRDPAVACEARRWWIDRAVPPVDTAVPSVDRTVPLVAPVVRLPSLLLTDSSTEYRCQSEYADSSARLRNRAYWSHALVSGELRGRARSHSFHSRHTVHDMQILGKSLIASLATAFRPRTRRHMR
jgi:hypothetical protein